MSNSLWWRRLLWATVGLTFIVIVLGAYVRLSHAGLGCPDWPGCYGHVTWPQNEHEIARANLAFPQRAVEGHKAGKEMVHRFFAGTLGLLVLLLAGFASARARIARLALVLSVVMAISAIVFMRFGFAEWALAWAVLASPFQHSGIRSLEFT